ncbi:MAG TPA: APC family permease [Streptosporangiaceae bacterium]|nr:APC family permease [Streptosporangiaceae bacterium]
MSTDTGSNQQLFVRKSTGLVREANAFDAMVFNAVFSAPVGATLAWGVFFALSVFPGADLVTATLVSFVINVPVLVMMALMASSMPRTGGDYIWVSRILSPPLATVSNFGAAFSAMIGATFWARYFPVFALGPTLVTFGIFFHNNNLIAWGDRFQVSHGWIFLGGLFMIVLMTAILIAGTKMTFRWQNTFWIIASAGTFLAFIVLAVGSSTSFQNHFNQLSARFGGHGNSYQHVINAVRGSISAHPNPGLLSSTLPAIFVIMTFMMWNWWSVYLSGELKSASNRNRQMKIMFTALAWDVVFICVGVLLIYKVASYIFMSAVNTSPNSAYVIPTGPWYHFLAALTVNVPVLTVLIVGSFLFWSLPAMVGNTFMPVRTVFAWAFDRLLPAKLADVNERTHSPVPAILTVMSLVTVMLVWSVLATTFQTWLALGVLAGVVCVWIVSVAAFTFPDRRPDLYQASPANIRWGRVPLLKIVSPISFLVMVFLVYDVLKYPALAIGTSSHWWYVPAFMGGTALFGLLVYYVAKYARRAQGVDVDLVYHELPPE